MDKHTITARRRSALVTRHPWPIHCLGALVARFLPGLHGAWQGQFHLPEEG